MTDQNTKDLEAEVIKLREENAPAGTDSENTFLELRKKFSVRYGLLNYSRSSKHEGHFITAEEANELLNENKQLQAELKFANNALASEKDWARMCANTITWFDSKFKAAEKLIDKLQSELEKMDEWQGRQSCNASVYEIEDDEFLAIQTRIHHNMERIANYKASRE